MRKKPYNEGYAEGERLARMGMPLPNVVGSDLYVKGIKAGWENYKRALRLQWKAIREQMMDAQRCITKTETTT